MEMQLFYSGICAYGEQLTLKEGNMQRFATIRLK